MTPAVSVIMPFLNQERYIAEAIESVRAQTMDAWELLLIDDGSTDASAAIAASFADRDPGRVRVLRHGDGGNHGAAASRNLGLASARGDFVAFLDADDLYERWKLESEVEILRRNADAAMLYGPACWWSSDGKGPCRAEKLGIPSEHLYAPPELCTRIILRHQGAVPCTCAVLMRRDVAVELGGFEEDFALYEDQTLWVKTFLRHPVFVTARPASRYRQHGESTSARARRAGEYHPLRMHAAELRFFEWLRRYVEANGIADPALLRAIRAASSSYRRPTAAAARYGRYLLWTSIAVARRSVRKLLSARPIDQ
jgi:glycosyltransferase involved in cell wall biosynthesis